MPRPGWGGGGVTSGADVASEELARTRLFADQHSPRFLIVREVAVRLRVRRATVYRVVDEGRLPAVRVSSGTIRVGELPLPRP